MEPFHIRYFDRMKFFMMTHFQYIHSTPNTKSALFSWASLFCLFFCLGLLAPTTALQAQQQEEQLARQYLKKGEYDKAALIYEKLFDENPRATHYYQSYFKALLGLKDYEKAEAVVNKYSKKRKGDVGPMVDLGVLFKAQDRVEDAEKQYERALGIVETNTVRLLANKFRQENETDFEIKTFLKGRELAKDPTLYAYDLARAYTRKGDIPNMMSAYLDYGKVNPKNLQIVKNAVAKVTKTEENMEEFQRQLYGRIQGDETITVYPELLTWAFIQQKDYDQALIQVKALDRRLQEDGTRVMRLASMAFTEDEYDTAIKAYEYVMEKGESGPQYTNAKIQVLKVRNEKITKTPNYTKEDIEGLDKDYAFFFEQFGKNPSTVNTLVDHAKLYAFYIHDLDKAIALLEEVIEMPGADKRVKSYAKLDLGDFYLMNNEVWESTLLYAQVDKAFKDDILGEEARFRNAKLSYYRGDFEWAQAQLKVLKSSTSELIANDALDLSVFITDHLGLDTTAVPMTMFARSELLAVQNKIGDAVSVLDSINRMYPKHTLDDDILLKRAHIKIQQLDPEAAMPYLEEILSNYGDGILADNALFTMADLYENRFEDTEKAMELYEKVMIDHPGSLFVIEARKRFRLLRGDSL